MEHALDVAFAVMLLTAVAVVLTSALHNTVGADVCEEVAFEYSNGTVTVVSGGYVTVIACSNNTCAVYRARTPTSVYVGNVTWVAALNYCSYSTWGNFSGGCLCVTGYYPEKRDTTCYCVGG